MFIYEIKPITQKLPSLLNLNGNVSPKDWKKTFSEFTYPELQKIKNELNNVKSKLDSIYSKKYIQISAAVRPHELLRGRNGILVKKYNAEIVTNAWLKMFELCRFLDPILKKNTNFKSFHFAEAPGNFILAIRFYLNKFFPKVKWEWLANSWRDLYSNKNSHYLSDVYGLIKKYKNNWLFGADGDGDITSPANIISFRQDMLKKLHSKVNLVTSDVKYVPIVEDYNNEEIINVPVHLGHILCAINTLKKGGVMILKQFTLFESPSISLLYLMRYCFDQLLITKPITSKSDNSEIYIVGLGFKNNISNDQFSKLLKIMGFIRFLNTKDGSPSIFTKKIEDKTFINQIIEVEKKLADNQIKSLERTISLYEKYKNSSLMKIKNDMQSMQLKVADSWIKQNLLRT